MDMIHAYLVWSVFSLEETSTAVVQRADWQVIFCIVLIVPMICLVGGLYEWSASKNNKCLREHKHEKPRHIIVPVNAFQLLFHLCKFIIFLVTLEKRMHEMVAPKYKQCSGQDATNIDTWMAEWFNWIDNLTTSTTSNASTSKSMAKNTVNDCREVMAVVRGWMRFLRALFFFRFISGLPVVFFRDMGTNQGWWRMNIVYDIIALGQIIMTFDEKINKNKVIDHGNLYMVATIQACIIAAAFFGGILALREGDFTMIPPHMFQAVASTQDNAAP
jgi:hypothetical protein